jgi:hypothetical protein
VDVSNVVTLFFVASVTLGGMVGKVVAPIPSISTDATAIAPIAAKIPNGIMVFLLYKFVFN